MTAHKNKPVWQEGDAEHPEAKQALEFIQRNAVPLLSALILVLVVFLAIAVLSGRRERRRIEAQQLLQAARDVEELRTVADEYAGTPAAVPALLELGAKYVQDGRFALARQAYGRLQNEYPEHFLGPAAVIGEAGALEGQQEYASALDRYRLFQRRHTGHYLRPMAVLGEARVLLQMGELEEAKARYEQFIADNPDSHWVPTAETALLYVRKEIRAASAGGENGETY